MGCNNSKLNPGAGGEILPAKIRPLLRHRLEEFRKRRNNGGIRAEEGALSKKQLLKEVDNDADDNDADVNVNGNKSHHLFDENQIEPVVRVVEKLSKVVPLPASEPVEQCSGEKDHHDQQNDQKDHVEKIEKMVEIKSVSAWPQQENKHEEANVKHSDDSSSSEDEEEEEDEEDDDEDETGRLIGPGSPSFRIYCIEAEKRKEKEKEEELREKEKQTIETDTHASEEKKETIPILHEKSPSADSNESAASESVNSRNPNEIPQVVKTERTPKRKGRKIKKLGAMKKNLLNVKNLQMNRMNRMMGCTGNDRRSLLADN